MKSRFRPMLLGTLLAAVFGLTLWQTVLAGQPGTPQSPVLFGKASLGNRPPTQRPDCPSDPKVAPGRPACFDPDHDSSGTALDQILPFVVNIDVGETVTYERGGGNHGVAIYTPGTDVEALQAAVGAGAGHFDIDNADFDRLETGPVAWPTDTATWTTWTSSASTFSEPGRYLVVCTFRPHFRDLDMYSWVVVH